MNLRFDHFNIDKGLSQNTVNCIAEDQDGKKWFGTQNGLNRFDGYSFRCFFNLKEDNRSLAGDGIQTLLFHNQEAWIGTNNGLSFFEFETEQFKNYRFEAKRKVEFNRLLVNEIIIDNNSPHVLWLGTNYGLLVFNKNEDALFSKDQKDMLISTSTHIRSICNLNKEHLIYGTFGEGLFLFDKIKQKHQQIGTSQKMRVCSMLELEEEIIIVTDKQGVFSYDIKKNVLQEHPSRELQETLKNTYTTKVVSDKDYSLWFGTQDKGLISFNPHSNKISKIYHDRFDEESLPSNWVRAVHIDGKNRLWVGTLTGGVSLFDSEKYKFKHQKSLPLRKNSIPSSVVRCFQEDKKGNFWIGTEGGGVSRYDRKLKEYVHYQYQDNNPNTINSDMVRKMYLDNFGVFWVFTWNGICFYDYDNDHFVRYNMAPQIDLNLKSNDLRFIFTDSDNNYWLGSENTVIQFDKKISFYRVFDSNPNNPRRVLSDMVRFIFEDNSKRIRLSAITGHSLIDRKNNEIILFNEQKSAKHPLSSHFMFDLHEDDSYYWYATMNGLYREHKDDGSIRNFGKKDGLPDNLIYSILEDCSGRFWMSTNKGITCFDKQKESFRNYAVSDGLQAEEFNNSAFYKANDGEMFFGGINGFNHFYPQDIKDSKEEVKLEFSDFYISEARVKQPNRVKKEKFLHIPYSARNFAIKYTAIEYSHPKNIQFAYFLEGFDQEYHFVGNYRTAHYRKVPAGSYVFKLKSTNKDGVWCQNEIAISIRVEKPQWLQALNPSISPEEKNNLLHEFIEEMQASNEELEIKDKNLMESSKLLIKSIYKDALTDAYNRAGYIEYLKEFSRGEYQPLGLIVIDIDGLKLLNDNLGHSYGDEILKKASKIFTDLASVQQGIVCRIGGDEFVILLPNYPQKKLEDYCRKIHSKIEKENSEEHLLVISYGFANSEEVDIEKLFALADERMYSFKRKHGQGSRQRIRKFIAKKRTGFGFENKA